MSKAIWSEDQSRWWVARRGNIPIAAIRFETQKINDLRGATDRKNYIVGSWCSWILSDPGSTLITWPEDTPIETMQQEVESKDIRFQ
jgi:hypothetical protein